MMMAHPASALSQRQCDRLPATLHALRPGTSPCSSDRTPAASSPSWLTSSIRRACAALSSVILLSAALPVLSQNTPFTAPFELTHDKPFVQVMVNGKGPFRFVIDTGTAGEAFVSGQLADELQLPTAGQVHLTDPSKQGGQSVPLVMVQSLVVAGVVFRDIKAVRHPLSQADGNCDGMLGFGLFRDYLLTLDYPNRRLSLATGSVAPDGGQSVLPFRTPYGIPIVPLNIGGVEFQAQIDSGGTGLSLPATLVSHLKFDSVPTLFGYAESLSTRFELRAAQLAGDVHLGGYTFPRPFVEIHSAFPVANFGSSAMQGFVFTFDQKGGLVRFQSSELQHRLGATPTASTLEHAARQEEPKITGLIPIG